MRCSHFWSLNWKLPFTVSDVLINYFYIPLLSFADNSRIIREVSLAFRGGYVPDKSLIADIKTSILIQK